MNFSLYCLSLNGYFHPSPIIVNRGIFGGKGLLFHKCFGTQIFSYGILRVESSIFQKNLDTSIRISSLDKINITFLSYTSFSFDSVNLFERCTFKGITSSQKSSGILYQANYYLKLSHCLFVDLTGTYSGVGGTALYANSGSFIEIYCNYFRNCRSPHGASYGIHNDQYSIAKNVYKFNSETFVGYNGGQTHSSYLGGRSLFECLDSNVSHVECSGTSGLFYFLVIPSNCEMVKRCYLGNSVAASLFRLYQSSPIIVSNMCFNNLSISKWVNPGQTITLKECSFICVTPNQDWSSSYMFIGCEFYENEQYYTISSSLLMNCLFSVANPNQNKPDFLFQCEGIFIGTKIARAFLKSHLFVLCQLLTY